MRKRYALSKLRGAYYAIHQLSDKDKARGVWFVHWAGKLCSGRFTLKRDENSGSNHSCASNNASPKISQVRFFGGKFVSITWWRYL